MKTRLLAALAAVVMTVSASAITIVSPLSYDTKFLAGTYDGKLGNSSPEEEIEAGQAILDAVGLGTIDGPVHTSNKFDYAGVLSGVGAFQGTGVIPAGWTYALAKYDGKQAGYVLFFLGGQESTIPDAPYNIWTTGTEQYGLSHWTVFNGTGVGPDTQDVSVPDGGSTAVMMGAAMLGIGLIQRRKLASVPA